MYLQSAGVEAANAAENGIGGLGPDKGLGLVVVQGDELGDGGFQFPHAGVRTALDLTLR